MDGQWKRLKELVFEARRLEEASRKSFLDSACGSDRELREEIEFLLSVEGRTTDFYANAPAPAACSETTAGGDSLEGLRIGPYRILGELGKGGMGVVYRATRDDGLYQGEVAVKVLLRGIHDAHLLARFEIETQVLAGMNHPHICKLLDAGTTGEGLRYIIMELVEGDPIDEYCRKRRLAIEQRLRLFRRVCAAVQYAHQNLVVHRDLKPSNILVKSDGCPKLLDFGIAKFFALASTLTVHKMITPDYASPEQIRGQKTTTAADVYSLGIILYELLTGQKPYRVGSLEDLARVGDYQPKKPSAALDQANCALPGIGAPGQLRRLRRKLRGDLDNIVFRAISKEPRDRYSSVEGLSDDVHRYLKNEPVSACADSVPYRVRKFVKRKKGATAAAVAIFASMVFFFAVTVQRRFEAEAEAARETAIKAFLQSVVRPANPHVGLGKDATLLQALQSAEKTLPETVGQDPEIEAAIRNELGVAYLKLGEYGSAEPHLRAALTLRERTLGEAHPDTATTQRNLAGLLRQKGDSAQARVLFERSIPTLRRFAETHSIELASSLTGLGRVQEDEGLSMEAERSYREGLSFLQSQSPRDPNSPELSIALARAMTDLAHLLHEKEPREAEELLQKSRSIIQAELGDQHPYLADVLASLGRLRSLRGNHSEAQLLLSRALDIDRRILGKTHPAVGRDLRFLADDSCARGEYVEAESLYATAIQIFDHSLGPDHRITAGAKKGLAECVKGAGPPIPLNRPCHTCH